MSAPNDKTILLATLGVCALLGGGTFLFLTRHQQPRPTPRVIPAATPAPVTVKSRVGSFQAGADGPPEAPRKSPYSIDLTGSDPTKVPGIPDAHGNWIGNGGFESPIIPSGDFLPLNTREVGMFAGRWVVYMGDVKLAGSAAYPAAAGAQSLDLNGTQTGAVYQDVFRVTGKKFLLKFSFGGNPLGGPSLKRMRVTWGNYRGTKTVADLVCDTSKSPKWKTYTYEVESPGDYARLLFQSLTPGAAGPAVDEVSLTEIARQPVSGDISRPPPPSGPESRAANAALGNSSFRATQRMLAQKFESEQRDLGATNARTLQTLQRLADVSASAGDWAGCVRYSRMLMAQTNCDLLILRGCAVAALLADDAQTYRDVCRRLLSESGPTPSPLNAERIAKVCLLAPGSVPDLAPVRQLADLAVKAHPGENWFILVKGLAEFRSDQPNAAIQTLDALQKDSNLDIASMAGFLMAMAYQQMDQADQAKAILAGANRQLQRSNSMARSQAWWWFDQAAANAIGIEAHKMVAGR